MTLISAQTPLALKNIFTKYGDSATGRELATKKLQDILKFWYGDAYSFNFYGRAVDSNGHITKYLIDRFESINNNFPGSTTTTQQAIALVESENLLNIAFIKDINPTYTYPYGYIEYRIAPYDITDRHEFIPLSMQRLKYKGCKLTGTGINVNSTETTDGGPVVKLTRVNQNQIVFSNNAVTTAAANTSGLPVRQLTSRNFISGTGRISQDIISTPPQNQA